MESLQKLLARISTQLRDLSRAQRLSILLGGLLVGVSLMWMLHWAATSEMVPLYLQDLQPEDLDRIQTGLETINEPFQLVGQKIMIRAGANRHAIQAQLAQQDKLPSDTSAGFNALIKESNPWISQAEHERRWTVALKHELELVLSQFRGVKSASVFLPLNGERQRFARQEAAATASVTLAMNGGEPVGRELALAAARLVCGAVRGLPLRNVEVLDGNGVSALDWESEAAGISGLDRQRRKYEQDIRAKIVSQLPDPKSRVAVQIELELTNRSSELQAPTDPVETKVETTSERTARARSFGQPGVVPNVGVSAGAPGADEGTSKETNNTEYTTGFKRSQEATPPGGLKEIWAAVSLSRSYLENVFRQSQPGAGDPTEQQLQQTFDREKLRVVSQLKKLVKPQDDEHVAVDWYYDTVLEPDQAPVRATTTDDALYYVQQYGPQSGLGLLAVISLGLMLRMARKRDAGESFGLEIGLPKEAIEAARRAARDVARAARSEEGRHAAAPGGSNQGADEVLEVMPAAIGQAAMTEGVLVAQEVDERTVQTNKMLDQVAQVVDTDSETAATLLEQWIQRSDTMER
jgi:flagellar biosynthesis/type III secretory pathway M-ring protein FliF/YscJ